VCEPRVTVAQPLNTGAKLSHRTFLCRSVHRSASKRFLHLRNQTRARHCPALACHSTATTRHQRVPALDSGRGRHLAWPAASTPPALELIDSPTDRANRGRQTRARLHTAHPVALAAGSCRKRLVFRAVPPLRLRWVADPLRGAISATLPPAQPAAAASTCAVRASGSQKTSAGTPCTPRSSRRRCGCSLPPA